MLGLATAALALLLAGCAHQADRVPSPSPGAAAPPGAVTLELPRPAARGEAVHLRVTAGVLPRGARLLVRTADGQIVGTVAPFGVREGQPAGWYLMPLSPETLADGEVELRLFVDESGDAPPRPPAEGEVRALELVYVPVTGG